MNAAVTVTDYSSQAFEAAYVERPVVYYEFDRAEFFDGTHVYRKGSWDYETDGFGPVTTTQFEALDAIAATATSPPQDAYLQRMRSAFAYRDGRCCERTFDSILALTRPVTFEQAYGGAHAVVPDETSGPGLEEAKLVSAASAGDGSEAVVADQSVDEAAMAWLTDSDAGEHDLTEAAAPRSRSVA